MTEDVRQNLPSASGIYRVVSCPGSVAAEKDLPELPKQKVTEEGSDIHEAAETGDDSQLSGDPKAIALRLKQMEHSIFEAWLNSVGNIGDYEIASMNRHAEVRLWMRDRKTLELLCSAQLDVLYVHNEYCCIIDFKTGFADVPAAEKNWQLLTQALCVLNEYPNVKHFRVAIAASRLSSKVDIAEYSREDLEHAERELLHALWLAKQDGAQRRPGPHCTYCRAKGHCPEATSLSLVTQHKLGIVGMEKLAILGAVNRLTPEQMAYVFVAGKIATTILDGVEARLKAMAKEELEKLGLTLKPGATRKSVADIYKAVGLMADFQEEEIIGNCATLSVSKLIELYAAKKSVSKPAAKEAVLSLLGDCVEEKQNAASLAILK